MIKVGDRVAVYGADYDGRVVYNRNPGIVKSFQYNDIAIVELSKGYTACVHVKQCRKLVTRVKREPKPRDQDCMCETWTTCVKHMI